MLVRLLAAPPAARAEFLRQLAQEQPELHQRLREIAATLVDDSSQVRAAAPVSDEDCVRALELALSSPGDSLDVIGPYKLLQKIGEGGFGIVWMAEQREPVRRRVAIKIIKGSMDTSEVIARFEAERQALAMMDHPNIARVFDAGETTDGRPYVVMELVRGVPITSYCDEQRLSAEARLRLFIAVCHAVQHAHQKGVIHRDLKPSNILVTLHDGVPVPKIIDFGIAKAVETPLTARTLFTQFHTFLGTPAYTSPEQMEMTGLDVDTRSDIYSLGVLLYELLAGRPPFEPDELLKSGLDQMRRTIREVEPPRPSHRVHTLAQDVRSTVARQRGTDEAKLSLLLRGDLDWIVMHSLEKDRKRRYATPNDFADDIRHFLADEPVNARPPSASYRVAKFVRRHRVGVMAGLIVTVALIAGTVISTLALVRESAAHRRAEELRVEASRAAARSDQIARFMQDMLGGIDPSIAQGRDNTVLREIMEPTRRRIDAELSDQPEVAAELRSTLASVYTSIGDFAAADKLLRQAISVFRAAQPQRADDLATALTRLGLALKYSDRRAEAEAAFQEAVDLRERLHGRRSITTAQALSFLSRVVTDTKRRREIREEVLSTYTQLLPSDAAQLGHAIYAIATVTNDEGDVPRALELFHQALDLRRRALGPNHPTVSEVLQSIGLAEASLGRPEQAISYFREALDIRRRVLGDTHPEVLSTFLRLVGVTPAVDTDQALIAAADAIIAAHRATLPRTAPGLAIALFVRASFWEFREGQPAKAAALRAEALDCMAQALRDGGTVEPRLFGDLSLAGQLKRDLGLPLEGVAFYDLAIAIYHGLPPTTERQRELGGALFMRSLSLYFGGRFADASEGFRECLTPLRSAISPSDLKPQMSRALWSECLLESGKEDEAWALMEPFLSCVSGAPSPPDAGPPETLSPVLYQLGRCAYRRGDLALAESAFQLARERAARLLQLPAAPSKLAYPAQRFDSALGLVRARQGRFTEAEALCQSAIEVLPTPRPAGKRFPQHVIDEARANLAEVHRLAHTP